MKNRDNFAAILFTFGVWMTLLCLFVSEINKKLVEEPNGFFENISKTKELIDGHP